MEPKTKEKKPARPAGGFDTVKFFRAEKERISRETSGMSYEELKAYLEKRKTLTKEK